MALYQECFYKDLGNAIIFLKMECKPWSRSRNTAQRKSTFLCAFTRNRTRDRPVWADGPSTHFFFFLSVGEERVPRSWHWPQFKLWAVSPLTREAFTLSQVLFGKLKASPSALPGRGWFASTHFVCPDLPEKVIKDAWVRLDPTHRRGYPRADESPRMSCLPLFLLLLT